MKTILIVEDDEFFLSLMAKNLSDQGFKVLKAVNGDAVLESVKTEAPDLILLDLLLPDKDGFEVLAMLKNDEKFAKIPVIVLSNLSQRDQIEKAMGLGANDFLIKSQITSEEVAQKVNNFFKG